MYNTPYSSAMKNFLSIDSEFTSQLDCVEVDLWAEIHVQLTVV